MVSLTDFQNATMLAAEYRSLDAAFAALEGGGRIVAMEIAAALPATPGGTAQPPTPPMPMMGMRVSTQGMDYPAQMITSIKSMLQARRDALKKQLADLGVSVDDATGKKGK